MNYLVIIAAASLEKILRGEKTIESRFSINRSPARNCEAGDRLYLKAKGGDILAVCEVEYVEQFEFALPYELLALEPRFWQRVHGEHRNMRYWLDAVKRGVRFAVFVHIVNVQALTVPASALPKNLPYASAWMRFEPPAASAQSQP